jgi:hypothetical protein
MTLLEHDRGAEGAVPDRRRFRVLRRPDRQVVGNQPPAFPLFDVGDIEAGEFGSA